MTLKMRYGLPNSKPFLLLLLLMMLSVLPSLVRWGCSAVTVSQQLPSAFALDWGVKLLRLMDDDTVCRTPTTKSC